MFEKCCCPEVGSMVVAAVGLVEGFGDEAGEFLADVFG
jgi:hypothetical protein